MHKRLLAMLLTATCIVASAQTVDVSEKRVALLPACLDVEDQLVTSLSRRALGANAEPLANVEVSVEDGSRKIVFTTKSDSNGKYFIRGLKRGDYRVVLNASGYIKYQYTLVAFGKTHSEEHSEVRLRLRDQCKDSGLGYEAATTSPADYCLSAERISPNLHLPRPVHVHGRFVDASGASIGNSNIELRRYLSENRQVSVRSATTGPNGGFDLGTVEEGEYRLIFLSRAFKQPEEMWCSAEGSCSLDITLQINPTDMPYANCPVR